jgi:hypothetical protein
MRAFVRAYMPLLYARIGWLVNAAIMPDSDEILRLFDVVWHMRKVGTRLKIKKPASQR